VFILITKAEIMSINGAGNRCVVRMPLFETAASSAPVTAEALVSIPPGIFNNLVVGDVVFVAFEENAIEQPIIVGKLHRGASNESKTPGGAGILDTLKVNTSATVPSSTLFEYPANLKNDYKELNTPKKLADYLKWLESLLKNFIAQLDDNFRCFKNWVQWQLKPENVEIDDGDLDDKNYKEAVSCQYQNEGAECKICGNSCTKNKTRRYSKIDKDKTYPKL
jgi:hypothetical protein